MRRAAYVYEQDVLRDKMRLKQGVLRGNVYLGIIELILNEMADWTRLELATPGVTGRYSNQLNYQSALEYVYSPSA